MKFSKIFWGLGFIAIAVLLILEALGVLTPVTSLFGEITFWQAAGGIALLCGIVSCIATLEFGGAIVLLGFLFMIFERNIAFVAGLENPDILHNGLVFGCSILLAAGFSILKPRRWKVSHRKNKRKKRRKSESFSGISNEKSNKMGASEIYIDCAQFGTEYTEQVVKNNFGALDVHFENIDQYKGGATLEIENDFGVIDVHVPRSWKVTHDIKCTMGVFDIEHNNGDDGDDDDNKSRSDDNNSDAPTLHVTGTVHFGAVEIEKV